MTRSHWLSFKPYFLFLPLEVTLLVFAGIYASYTWTLKVLFFGLGLLGWTILEYGIHRVIFHLLAENRWSSFLAASHQAHHRAPQDIELVFAQLSISLPVSGLWFLILWVALGRWEGAALALAGTWAGYMFYEFVHYSAHFGMPKTAFMRSLKAYHILHHHEDDRSRFGVTSPLIDWVFGTYRPRRVRGLSSDL